MVIFHTIDGIDSKYGGPSRCVPRLAHALTQIGLDVRLFTLSAVRPNLNKDNSLQYSLCDYEHNSSAFQRLKALRKLQRELSLQIDECSGKSIIHDNGIWLLSNHMSVSTAINSRTPLVITTHGMISPWAMKHKSFKKIVAWKLYQERDLLTANLIHATSQQEAENIYNLKLKKPVAIVPNGVDIPLWRERPIISGNKKTILFLSRIYPVKGLLNLVHAWQQIKSPDWKIVVAGPDESGHQKEVMDAIHVARLDDWFEFIGPVGDDDKWDLFFKADLFVLPSFTENFGIVIAEALACGLPVITTTGTPWQDLLTHKCGWWVDIGVEQLAEALSDAISRSDAERTAMGLRGRQFVESSFGWDKIAREMRSVYEWVLHGGTQPACVRLDL